MTTTEAVSTALAQADGLCGSVVRERGHRTEVLLPLDLHDGASLSLHVERLSGDMFIISDRGQVSTSLSIAGVEFARARKSWERILDLLPDTRALFPAEGRHPLEIAAASPIDELAEVMKSVAETMLRADGLMGLAKASVPKRKFAAKMMDVAVDAGLAVVPSAPIPSKIELRRQSSFSAEAERAGAARIAFVKTIAGEGTNAAAAHDTVLATFADADVPFEQRVTIISRQSDMRRAHRKSLERVSLIVEEEDATGFWRQFALAA